LARFYAYKQIAFDKPRSVPVEQVPAEVLDEFYMSGDSETIIRLLEEYVRGGHIIPWNVTGMFDLERVRSSYKVLKEVLAYVKR